MKPMEFLGLVVVVVVNLTTNQRHVGYLSMWAIYRQVNIN